MKHREFISMSVFAGLLIGIAGLVYLRDTHCW